MTTDYSQLAILKIRKYIIQEVHASGISLGSGAYPALFNSQIPVVPLQQLPETNELVLDKPFITYDFYQETQTDDAYWITPEVATFHVHATDILQVVQLQNLLVDLFRRFDLAATDINTVSGYDTITILSTEIEAPAWASKPEPATSESGRIVASLSILYTYTRSVKPNGRFAS